MEFITEQEAASLIELGIPEEISLASKRLVERAYMEGVQVGLDGVAAKAKQAEDAYRQRVLAIDAGRYLYRQFLVWLVAGMFLSFWVWLWAHDRILLQQEESACRDGQILACQKAVITSNWDDRRSFLRTVYRDATEKELPAESPPNAPRKPAPGEYNPETGSHESVTVPGRGDTIY